MPKISHLKYPWNGGWVGMMLIRGKKNILLDSAVEEAVPTFLKDALADAGITFQDLDYLINTHEHEDHSGGNAAIKKIVPNCPTGIHVAGSHRYPFDFTLTDNMCIDGGDYTLRLLHTPGHSPDASSFLIEEEGVVFTGDSFQGCGCEFASLILVQNVEQYCASVDRMQSLAEKGVYEHMYLGHEFIDCIGGKPVPELHGKEQIVTFLENCRDIAVKYLEFCKANRHLTLEECIDAIDEKYGCTKAPFMPWLKNISIRQFLAQLD